MHTHETTQHKLSAPGKPFRRDGPVAGQWGITCLLALLLVVMLGGCELRAESSSSAHTVRLQGPAMAGDYLASRFADRHMDTEQAAHYALRALGEHPYQAHLLQYTWETLIRNGQAQEALLLTHRFRTHHRDRFESHFSSAHLTQMTHLFLTHDFDKAQARAEQYQALSRPKQDYVSLLLLPLYGIWAEAGRGSYARALEKAKALQEEPLPPMVRHITAQHMEALQAYAKPEHVTEQETSKQARLLLEGSAAQRATFHLAQFWRQIALMLHEQQNGATEALIYARLAHWLDDTDKASTLLLARLFHQYGNHQAALALYHTIPKTHLLYEGVMMEKASLHHEEGDAPAAHALLSAYAGAHPLAYQVWLKQGDFALLDGEHARAIEYYSEGLQRILDQSGETEEEHWAVLYARGIAYEQSGQWPLAEADFLHALTLKPDQPEVMNYLAYSWLTQGKNVEQAERMLKIALLQRPSSAHIMDSYGWALYMLGRYEDARAYLEAAGRNMPYDPTINHHIGDVYWKLGRRIEARYQWERALLFSPKPEEKEALEHKLVHGMQDPHAMRESQLSSTPTIVAED